MNSLFETVNRIVGNVDWGEPLTVASCEFPGLNTAISGRTHLNMERELYYLLTTSSHKSSMSGLDLVDHGEEPLLLG